ncbi:MAG TPA: hypothetical protein VHX87_10955 [Galbitalea sp.]|jgi:hypothetical protein|nr:hypothetical protein [Galbitalea sp.]
MSAPSLSPAPWRRVLSRVGNSPTALWSSFILVHLWLGFQNLTESGLPLGDVIIQYKYWSEQADLSNYYVGIDKPWVYPIVALLPMILAGVFGFANYAGTWLGIVFALDLVAFAVMVGWYNPGRAVRIGWWWTLFLLLLGPIALGRIDSITVPIAIIAMLFLASRPKLAAFLLTLATWIKVWPAALLAAVLIASKARVRILVTAVITSAVIITLALLLGAGPNVFSFVSQQTSRGLQVESPASTIWMWMSFAHVPGAYPWFDSAINTFEVTGPNSLAVAALLNPLLGLVAIVIAILGIVAVQRGTAVTELLAPLSLALVTGFIAFNKVGSPQYMTWLAVPIILGVATRTLGYGRSFLFPAIVALLAAGLTQVFYPVNYESLLELHWPLLVVLTLRNVLVLVLFGWSVGITIGLTRPFRQHETVVDESAWLPAAWPFALRTTRAAEEAPGQGDGIAPDDDPSTA